ncbi:hypothetical protein UAY_01941 [Enterococcus moraviensis ATCC BAA-383]|uniref:N-acetyltransferase domain-containing protein n=1 Tax=Enterococcus moraviensis ATCC BAA-383 TaxID=1158609 RepID=R2TG76_9ENTE|nr:GNAT family N-acetyltransferase [Enterococcus moraviensis]EOH99164.1 hypothetical protein UAY_01941 [Enterococcus moraviensis ATCC BAA-383]EOT72153.1 hypothetical protein I586_01961 [Enterococcus moraviensis ATCC BAA-383]OJG67414.1 hypothetical protein RV09_GL002630 [Enterococcus moraviensis]
MVKIIDWNSEDYWIGIHLRNKLLKTSSGKEWITELPVDEKHDIHMAVMMDGAVVGTLLLSKKSQTVAQIKQVAIDDNYHGIGLGKKLLEFAEKVAELMKFQTIILTGRKQAWGFYDRFGYQSSGCEYEEGLVSLKRFEKRLQTQKNTEKFRINKPIQLKEMETNG